MALALAANDVAAERGARPRRYLLCRPGHFDVVYAINPWMHPGEDVVDGRRALAQWEALRAVYVDAGHDVHVLEDVAGLPDMVFAANAGLVLDGRVLLARFSHPERQGEEGFYRAWFEEQGLEVRQTVAPNEGEGDLAVVGDTVLAGHGFRTAREAHDEVAAWCGREVVSLRLVDPRYYHLDTALAPLDDERVVWFPGAFDGAAQAELRRRFPDGIEATASDAAAFGLNACSDGHRVVLSADATALAERLRREGFEPVPVELGELRKSGGSAKCCTLELRP